MDKEKVQMPTAVMVGETSGMTSEVICSNFEGGIKVKVKLQLLLHLLLHYLKILLKNTLSLLARSQWTNSESSFRQDFNRNYSNNWNTNNGFFALKSERRNGPNYLQPVSGLAKIGTEQSDFTSSKQSPDIYENKNSDWNSNTYYLNRQPSEEVLTSKFEKNKNFDSEYESSFQNDQKSFSVGDTHQLPKKQYSGNSGNWQPDAFRTNKRPNGKELASITNWGNNKFSSDSNKIENTLNSGNTFGAFTNSINQNPKTFKSSSFYDNYDANKKVQSPFDYEVNSFDKLYSSNNNENAKSTTNFITKGESAFPNFNQYKNEGNNQREPSLKKTLSDKKYLDSNSFTNSESDKWKKNEVFNNKFSFTKNEITPEKQTQYNSQNKISKTSILDELDKNDWYFGENSKYPAVPLKSSLNIDVSELWDFNRSKKSNANFGKNSQSKKRKNRDANQFKIERNCECVNINLCDEENTIVTKKDLTKDISFLEEIECDRLTDICCDKTKITSFMATNIPGQSQEKLRHYEQRKFFENLSDFGDDLTQIEEFPWNLRIENSENDVNCSASLIHPKMALTAGHCVENLPLNIIVKAGLWNSNGQFSQSQKVKKIILHPNYNSKKPRNDIALLLLENSFILTDNVNIIYLPRTDDMWDQSQCFVTSWKPKRNSDYKTLQKEIISFIPQNECQNILLVTDGWLQYVLHDSFLCGIEENWKDVCLGDEGSAVICPSKNAENTFLQIGIVSKSINCDDLGRPGIFTNILKFLDWINENALNFELFDNTGFLNLK